MSHRETPVPDHGSSVPEGTLGAPGCNIRVRDSAPLEVIRATGERARKTALGIVDGLPEAPVGDGTPPGLDRSGGMETVPERPGVKHVAPAPARPAVEVREPAAAVVGW